MSTRARATAVVSLSTVLMITSVGSGADDAPEPPSAYVGVEELVVTAQRRSENLQDVPISVAAFGEDAIDQRDITSFADIAKSTPGFQFSQHVASQTPTVRGVGSDRYNLSAEPGVALYVDDVYYGRPYLPSVDLIELERIEILRGPQGTLYGRNATGGAMKLITKQPSDTLEASASGQYGSFDQKIGHASVSGPVFGGLLLRGSVYYEEQDGWLDNPTRHEKLNDHHVISGKGKARYEFTDWLRLDVSGDYSEQREHGPAAQATTPVTFSALGDGVIPPTFYPYDVILNGLQSQLPTANFDPLKQQILTGLTNAQRSSDPRVVYLDHRTITRMKSEGFAATLSAELWDIDAKWINGYRSSSRFFDWDVDMTSYPGITELFDSSAQQESSELQFSSEYAVPPVGGFDLGSVHWLAGGFFYHERARELVEVDLVELNPAVTTVGDLIPDEVEPIFTRGNVFGVTAPALQETTSYAGFTDLEWRFREWLRFHLGLRYSVDEKESTHSYLNPLPNQNCTNNHGSKTYSRPTYRAGVDVPINDDLLVYASFADGYKSGGFNTFGCSQGSYEPETIKAYETGLKSQWFDGRIQFNISAFHYDYTDLQQEEVLSLSTVVKNAPKAEVNGGEIQAVWRPLENLTIDGGLAYLDARFREFSQVDPYTAEGLLIDLLLIPGVPGNPVDLAGNHITKSPEWMANAGIEPSYPIGTMGDLSARLQWSYTDNTYFDNYNHAFSRRPAFWLLDLFLTYEHHFYDPDWNVGLRGLVKNLTDETYIAGLVAQLSPVGGPFGFYAPPREWGVELFARF